jgi:hypothetical protein
VALPIRRRLRRGLFATVVLVPLVACLACGSDEATSGPARDPEGFPVLPNAHPATCGGYQARLAACGLLSDGPFRCYEPETDADRCEFACVTAASCPILWEFQCREAPGVLQNCLSLCRTFVCADGSALPDSWQCDTEADCFDGSDELDCATFECGSGEVYVERAHCNLQEECADGSDEVGCPGFRCESGPVTIVPEYYQCDGEDDCLDGSDEVGCATFRCASTGEELPVMRRCDQVHDCLDSSDEVDCAEVVCR